MKNRVDFSNNLIRLRELIESLKVEATEEQDLLRLNEALKIIDKLLMFLYNNSDNSDMIIDEADKLISLLLKFFALYDIFF
jgi:hypothetical protein